MPKVFVLQDQRELNQAAGRLQNKFDFTDAERFGELVYCLPSHVSVYDLEEALKLLKEKLQSFSANDYILPIGAPALMAIFGAMAADKAEGALHILSWHNNRKCYIPILADSIWLDNAQEGTHEHTEDA